MRPAFYQQIEWKALAGTLSDRRNREIRPLQWGIIAPALILLDMKIDEVGVSRKFSSHEFGLAERPRLERRLELTEAA